MNILKCQGWQRLLVYFERQTMYHEYIKMSRLACLLVYFERQTMYHEYIKMSMLAIPLSIL